MLYLKTKREKVSQLDRKRYCFAQFDHMAYHLFTIMETSVCLLYILLKKKCVLINDTRGLYRVVLSFSPSLSFFSYTNIQIIYIYIYQIVNIQITKQ